MADNIDSNDNAPAVAGVTTEDNTLLTDGQNSSDDNNSTDNTNTDNTNDDGNTNDGSNDNDNGDGGADEGGQDSGAQSYADFNLPEGMELDGELLEQASALFKEDNLTQEQAQKYIDFYAGQIKAGAESQADSFNQLMDDWRAQSQADKDFGGDNFEESIGIAKQALDKFGTPALTEFLETHGAGNHPEMIRFMVKVGRLTMEDNPGNMQGNQHGNKQQDHVTLLYGEESNG